MINSKLNELEISALISANKTGQIDIPSGSAVEIETFLSALLHMEKAGLVSRADGKAFYRPFTLTKQGQTTKAALLDGSAKEVSKE